MHLRGVVSQDCCVAPLARHDVLMADTGTEAGPSELTVDVIALYASRSKEDVDAHVILRDLSGIEAPNPHTEGI